MKRIYRYDFRQVTGEYENHTSILTDFEPNEAQMHALTKRERGIDKSEEFDEAHDGYWWDCSLIFLPTKGAEMDINEDGDMLKQLVNISGLELVTLTEYEENIMKWYEAD